MKHRSTTFICGICGKCHTFYGKDADDIHNINSVLCDLMVHNTFWDKKLSHYGIIKIITSLFTCCDNPKITSWKYKELEVEQ